VAFEEKIRVRLLVRKGQIFKNECHVEAASFECILSNFILHPVTSTKMTPEHRILVSNVTVLEIWPSQIQKSKSLLFHGIKFGPNHSKNELGIVARLTFLELVFD